MFKPPLVLSFSLALLIFLAVATQRASPQTAERDSRIPPEVANNSDEWPLGNYDYSNTRATFTSQINSSNVSTLGVAWTLPIESVGNWGAAAGNPIIADGVVYAQDLACNVYAIDLATGQKLWSTTFDNPVLGPAGPGIGYGKIVAAKQVDEFVALDMATGQQLWTYRTGNNRPTGAIQPIFFDNRIFLSTQTATEGQGNVTFTSYQGGYSGVALVLDPEKGDPLWEWVVVEEGFWGNPNVNSGGGIWFPPAIDMERNLTYWATGNPAPIVGIAGYPNGSSRPGDNLYTNSVVALDYETGEMAWYTQVIPHDLFNFDFHISPILATVTMAGEERDIVIGAGKNGHVVTFDRDTGDILWDTAVGVHENDELTELPPDETVWVTPGAWGGVETPMAYADGVVYVLTANLASPYHYTMWDAENGAESLNRSEGGTLLENGTVEVNALDAATGEIIWRVEFDRVGFSGVTVVNDLLFTATLDGTIYALSRADGLILWEFQAPGGTNAWPAVAGDTIVWPIGIGGSPMFLALRLNSSEPTPTLQTQHTPVQTPQGQ